MAKLNCPDFDGFAMCTSQPLSKVASYEWCRKYLEGLEEVNGTLSTDLFLRLLRKAYSDAYYGAIHMELVEFCKTTVLINEPFKKYIQEHLDEFKVEESEALPVQLRNQGIYQ